MNNFVFYSPTEFVFGKDTEIQTGTLAKKYNARKAMIVYGGGSIIRSGLLQRIEESLQQAGVEYVKLGGIQPNPTDPKVYEGIELARKEGVDFMLPVGGGSVIDTAKAIAAGVPYEGDFWDFYIGKAKVKKALKVGVVLTIPAAGSEGSGNTAITKLEGLQKLSLRVPELLRPVFAVMNPDQFFGGTSLLILVGVVLDTLQQVESHLLMRHYDGLLKSGRIKGRSGNVAAY